MVFMIISCIALLKQCSSRNADLQGHHLALLDAYTYCLPLAVILFLAMELQIGAHTPHAIPWGAALLARAGYCFLLGSGFWAYRLCIDPEFVQSKLMSN